jgi:hypothetical protein
MLFYLNETICYVQNMIARDRLREFKAKLRRYVLRNYGTEMIIDTVDHHSESIILFGLNYSLLFGLFLI